jgi:hypothetical protein
MSGTASHAGSAFAAMGVHHGALDLISQWNSGSMARTAALPIIASLLFILVWPIVAVIALNADAQLSIGVAFIIAMFILIVTVIFIALAAFWDTRDNDERLGGKKHYD